MFLFRWDTKSNASVGTDSGMILMLSCQAALILLSPISGWPKKEYGLGKWSRTRTPPTGINSDTAQRPLGYLTSPSGVSEGQSIPHWDGWSDRGPLTFLVFSNWEEILVIMPSADIYDKRDNTWVTPWRSILNLFRDQFPCREKTQNPWLLINCLILPSYSEKFIVGTTCLQNYIQQSKCHN